MLEKAASFHKNLISERYGSDTAGLEEENRRLSIELAIARKQEKVAQERAATLEQINFVLQRSTERLSAATDSKAIIVEILRTAAEVLAPLGVNGMGLIRYQPETRTARVKVHIVDGVEQTIAGSDLDRDWSADHPTMAIPWQRIQSEDFIWGLTSDTSVLIAEVRQYHESLGARSIAYIPLRRGEETTGWIGFNLASEMPPTAQQIEMIQALTRQVSLAAEMERLAEIAREAAIVREREQVAQAQAAELAKANTLLRNSLSRLSTTPNLNDILGHLLVELASYTGASVGHIFIHDADQQTLNLRVRCQAGETFWTAADDEPWLFQAPIALAKAPIFGELSAQPRLAILNQPEFEGRLWTGVAEWFEIKGYRSTCSCILMVGDRPLGWLAMAFSHSIAFSSVEEELILALAQQIALVIQLTLLSEVDKQNAIACEQEQAAQERAAELAKANRALRRAIAHLTKANSLQLFLNAVLKEVFQTSSGVNGAAVFDYEPTAHTVQLLGLVISGEVIDIASDPRAEIYRSPIPSEAAGDWHIPDPERRIVWIDIDDPVLLHTPEAVHWHKQHGHQLLNVIPLFSGEQPLGFLGLAFTTRTPPSDAQIEHWWALAQHVGLALRLANLAEEAKQTAILDERNRMARDIHDTLAQSFTGIIMQLEALKSFPMLAADETQAHLNRIRDIARLGLSEARRSVQALRPVALETASFPDALRHLLTQMTQSTPVQTTLHIEGVVQSLPASVEENLLRIAQEAVTNAIRHGQAQTIALQLLFEPTAVHLQIRDDGQGFAPTTHLTSGFGLIGMQERVHHLGGHLHLVSQPGQGTEITVTIPSKE